MKKQIFKVDNKYCPVFLKFGRKDHLESLQRGKLYFKEVKYYIDLENKTGNVGVGDKYDSTMLQRDTPIWINGVRVTNVDKITGRYDKDERIPVFCCTYVTEDNFKYDIATDEYKFDVKKFQIERFKEFGDYVLIITYPELFLDYVCKSCDLREIGIRFKSIDYVDYDYSNSWINLYRYDSYAHFFIKDKGKFEWQNEFRIIVLNQYTSDEKDYYEIEFGDFLMQYGVIIKVDDVDDNSICYRL